MALLSTMQNIEKRAEERLDIQFGKAYFIRCEVGGWRVGGPTVNNRYGSQKRVCRVSGTLKRLKKGREKR